LQFGPSAHNDESNGYSPTPKRTPHKRDARTWLTLHSTYSHGAIKIEWIDSSRTLLCRAITKRKGQPQDIVGDFVRYVMARFRRRVEAITIVPE
jgi:hypothetical protein